ncbi:response regulator [Sphingomonas sp. ac-8]|uniref:response regulator n=1 Tax=Sphingomonas sp. ac-8 TaxID=3242977 RepID=UPI003A7FFB67
MTDAPHSELPKILIVDDEQEILVALEDLLEERYELLSSTSPVDALDLIRANPDVAVIISDQRMPEMPGNVFLSRARPFSDADAILLTGYADLSAVISAVNEGAISGYAAKPWEPEALLAMVAAAAERQRLRAALRFEQSAFAGLMDASSDRISVLDRRHRVIRGNHDADAAPGGARDKDEQALASGSYSEEDLQSGGAEQEERWTRVRRIPFGDSGSERHLLKIESDETERRNAARRLHQAEKLQALGTLAGGIAHDFNNLLAAILGNLELAERSLDKPDRLARFLANARSAAGRGSAITRRLLSFSRQRDLAAETFEPDVAIRELEELIARTMAGRVSLALDLAADGAIHADPGQFELAVVNLCINARDAMANGGEIVVSTARVPAPPELPDAGECIRIAVRDQGAGIAEHLRDRVFEPFFTTKPHGEGTGLGLPMVRAMAEASGGTVTIDSRVGEGTTVALWFPRLDPVDLPDCMAAPGTETPCLRVLAVEDDAEVRAVLVAHLTAAGHQVVEADGAEAALHALDSDAEVDLMVTDYAMPEISGLDLFRLASERRPGLPAILVTGFADVEDGTVPLPVLTKPFTGDQLKGAITRAMAPMA